MVDILEDELTEIDIEELLSSLIITDSDVEAAYESSAFRVIYQTNNYFLPQIRNLVKEQSVINVRPEYQRRSRWTRKQKSHLIESLLLNIPIPSIYLYESDLAEYEVMDGQQRISAIFEYFENDYPLSSLGSLSFLNGKRYNQLPALVKRNLDRASLSAVILLKETRSSSTDPYLVRKQVFHRLNTGGRTLNAQEVRNSLYKGPLNDLIVQLSRDDVFCEVFGIPTYTPNNLNDYYDNPKRQANTLYRTMSDCQIILRFFALRDRDTIKGAMRNILDSYMEDNLRPGDEAIEEHETSFRNTIRLAKEIFGDTTFRLPAQGAMKARLSVALYDAVMVALYRLYDEREKLLAGKAKLKKVAAEIASQDRELLTGQANTAQAVRDRIDRMANAFKAQIS